MKNLFAGAAALLGILVCASAPASAQTEPAFAPALYVVRDADSTLYLYGTIHLRRTGEPWGGPHVEAALAESDEIWTEVAINPESEARGRALALREGMAPAGQPLSSWLSPEEQGRLAALSQRFGLPAGALEPMRPWLASLTLVVLPMMQAGYNPEAGVDRAIAAWGAAAGRTMRAFETMDEQIGFFTNLSEEAQRGMLLSAMNDAEGAAVTVDAMSAAWAAGDMKTLERMAVREVRDAYPEFYEALFVRRNDAWMAVLLAELAGAGVDFVAVGAGHMVGPEGLVAQFEARGYTVERVPAH